MSDLFNAPNHEPAVQRPSRARLFSVLPRLSGTAVAVRNRIYASPVCLLSDERLFIWQDNGAFPTVGELVCRTANAPLAIAADSLSRLEPRLEGFESFVPTETCTALVEHALSPVLLYLERLTGVPIECDEFRRGPAPRHSGEEVTVGFAVFEPTQQLLFRGWMRTTPEAWAGFDLSRGVTLQSTRRRAVTVRLAIELGRCRVTAAEVKRLAVGDALRPGRRLLDPGGPLPVELSDPSGRFRVPAQLNGDTLTLENPVTNTLETSGSESGGPADAPPNADPLDDIECDLTFELGSLRMTVAEVSRMRAGQAMRLGVRLQEKPVRVMVNGRPIAKGELAVVGDELVVVITDTSRMPAL